MKNHITAIVSTIVIATFSAGAHADAATPSAATASAPYAVTHNTPFAANSPEAKEEIQAEKEYAEKRMGRPETHLQHERAILKEMKKREAYLKAHKDMKAAAIEGKRIDAKKAEITKLEREAAAARVKSPAH